MENLNSNLSDPDKKPDQTGSPENIKKKKRKTTKVPLPIEKAGKQEAKQQPENKEKAEKVSPEIIETTEELVLPDAEELIVHTESDKATYQGELIIDHSNENEAKTPNDEQETIVGPENGPTSENLSSDVAETAQTSDQELLVTDTEPLQEETGTLADPEAEPVEIATLAPNTEIENQPPDYPVFAQGPDFRAIQSMIDPNVWNFGRVNQLNVDSAPTQSMVTEQEAHDRALAAEKRGLSRGVVSGALVGWWVGRRGKRKAEREATMSQKNRDETIKHLTYERNAQAELSSSRLGLIERTQAELRNIMRRSRRNQQTYLNEVDHLTKENQLLQSRELNKVPESAAPVFETAAAGNSNTQEKDSLPVEEREITEATYLAPEGSRYQVSAWHRIEVDNRTGQAVENPAQAYGEAFTREQQQEKLAREAAAAHTAGLVGMTLMTANGAANSGSLSVPIDESTFEQPSTQVTEPNLNNNDSRQETIKKELGYAGKQILHYTTSPVIWGIALLLVLALISLGIIG